MPRMTVRILCYFADFVLHRPNKKKKFFLQIDGFSITNMNLGTT